MLRDESNMHVYRIQHIIDYAVYFAMRVAADVLLSLKPCFYLFYWNKAFRS